VHFHVRKELRDRGWKVIAGQYPGGSDDLPSLNVVDPTLAIDRSPDPRRHSKNKLVPDLVACCGGLVLLIEMKDAFDRRDETKLLSLLAERRGDLVVALRALESARPGSLCVAPDDATFVAAIGLPVDSPVAMRDDFAYFFVSENLTVEVIPPTIRAWPTEMDTGCFGSR